MTGGRFVIALLVGLVVTAAWADPFSEVPSGHWAYRACSQLVTAGFLSPDRAADFSGGSSLTRLELATAVLSPLGDVDRELRALPAKADDRARRNAAAAALRIDPSAPDNAIAKAIADLAKLATEFREELRTLGLDPALAGRGLELLQTSPGVRKWRAEALSYGEVPRAPERPSAFTGGDLRVPVGQGAMGFTYREGAAAPSIMNYLALSSPRVPNLASGSTASAALPEPVTSRLRTTYEYPFGRRLAVGLGYEEFARRGAGDAPLDVASLAFLGVGFRPTPSTSIRLSYSLFDYQSFAPDTPPLREHLAETAVSVEF